MPQLPSGHPPVEVRIQLLNGFSVSIGERQISDGQFRLRKSRNLIKLLALTPNHRLQRDQLLELLWPDQDPQTAAANFYQALYETRRILDPSGARASPQRYLQLHEAVLSLCPDSPVSIDAEAFRTTANRALRTQDQAAYRAALALYPGDLLPDDLYEDWAREMRETLHQDHLRLLLGLAILLENQKDYSAAMNALKQVVEADSTNEEAHAGLMRLYASTGQRTLALRQYQLLEETLQRELEAQPDSLITRLYQEILSGQYTPPDRLDTLQKRGIPSQPTHNLPVQLTSFIGREVEKQTIKHLLLPQLPGKEYTQEKEVVQIQPARLLTLTGAGGSGKTRLALETATELLENYREGVWLVELAGLSDPDLIPQTVISALHIQSSSGQAPLSSLTDYLKHRQILLMLDNSEHLVEACARLVETLLKNCPYLQILVTSQEILGLPGEVSYSLAPLSLPDLLHLLPAKINTQSEAVRLFVDRARYVLPGFTLNESNASSVAQICRRLDGIPLAIELAAARVKMMQVEEIAAHLVQNFDLLTGGSRTALPRYQSLHASIDWSYHLLSDAERLLFRRLAVFAGSWNIEEARFIVTGDASPEGSSGSDGDSSLCPGVEMLGLLTQLVNKSLITPHQTAGTQTRYFYLDTIRRFALDRLRDAGEEDLMRDRHLDYYEQLGGRLEPLLRGPDLMATMISLEADYDNLRTALEWSLATQLPAKSQPASNFGPKVVKGLRLAGDLIWFWLQLFNGYEGAMWVKRLLAAEVEERGLRPLDPPRALARGRALYMIGWFGSSDTLQSLKYLEEGLSIFRELGTQGRRDAAYVLFALARWYLARGNYPQAQAMADESMALFREVGDLPGLTQLLGQPITSLALNQGDFTQAKKYMEEALVNNQKLGDLDGVGGTYRRMGEVAAREGNFQQAWTLLEKAQEIYCRTDNKIGNYLALEQMGKAALAQGDPQHAEAIFSEALDLTRQVNAQSQVAASLAYLGKVAFNQGKYERASQLYRQAIETARKIEDNHTLACALRGLAEANRAGGDVASALRLIQESLQVLGELIDRREIYLSLEALVGLDLGQPDQAVRLFSAIQGLYVSMCFSFSPRHRAAHSEKASSLKSQLGETVFNQLWNQGQALTIEQAIHLGLSLKIS